MTEENNTEEVETEEKTLEEKTLKGKTLGAVGISYALACILLGVAAFSAKIGAIFWPIWLVVSLAMQREVFLLKRFKTQTTNSGQHFQNQVLLGGLLLLGLILGRLL